mmetsp:Transcript_36047/g.53768  ORF Transcript_36047/g.53768 Transcript_36047/m.53768 type:complete len:330 (-) Transcript_36047:216-1205(-)
MATTTTTTTTQIPAIRTPEERFTILPGFPYKPTYIDTLPGYESLRMAYYDIGTSSSKTTTTTATNETFLCLHGEPSWSYLYRKMIPIFESHGRNRVICVDLFGFGRSDKPTQRDTYTFTFHRNSLLRLVEHLSLRNITLVCQDWGGVLGLTLPLDLPAGTFTNAIVMNTGLPPGRPPSKGFMQWRQFAEKATDIPVSGGIALDVGPTAMNLWDAMAYDAPFPDARFKAGVHQFPLLVAITPEMDGAALTRPAAKWWRESFTGKAFVAVGVRDRVVGVKQMQAVRDLLFDKCSPPLFCVEEGGHFVQEYGEEIAMRAMEHLFEFKPSSKL